jgi:hypothetical protein
MKTGSGILANVSSAISRCDRHGQQPHSSSNPAPRLGWMRYGAIISLVLLNPPMAEAATPPDGNWLGSDTTNPVKSEVLKTPKAYPSDFPVLNLESPETVRLQQFTAQPPPEPTVPIPLDTGEITTAATALRFDAPAVSVSQSQVNPEPTHSSAALTAQETNSSSAFPWRFSFEPYVYLPFGASGNITVNGVEAPIDAGIGDIFDAAVNDLNFAAFGRVEAWNGPWGILFDGTYMNVGTGESATIDVPPEDQLEGLPPQVTIDAAVGTSYTKLDLAGGYRFGDGNLANALRTADTEFDLGPFVFDAIAGLRLYFFNNDLVLTDDLGRRYEFSQSRTIAEPMIGGRARWNLSDNLAVLTGASLSGFGIGGLTFSVDGYAGVDWLFSGNTSLLASYRLTYVDYSSGSSGLNLFTHGPMLGVKFRF